MMVKFGLGLDFKNMISVGDPDPDLFAGFGSSPPYPGPDLALVMYTYQV